MRIGIVGSRTYPRLNYVQMLVGTLSPGTVVVSGGASGVDTAVVEYAKARGLEIREHLPDLSGPLTRSEVIERYYARNQRIVDDCDFLIAFTEKRTGGTWDTIRRARKAGKCVVIFNAETKRLK